MDSRKGRSNHHPQETQLETENTVIDLNTFLPNDKDRSTGISIYHTHQNLLDKTNSDTPV